MNLAQFGSIALVLVVLVLPIVLGAYFVERNTSEPEEYDYR